MLFVFLQLPVKQLYKAYLQTHISESSLELDHNRLQIKDTQVKIQWLDHQLKVGDLPTGEFGRILKL